VLEKLDALGVAIDRETVIEFGGMTVAAFVRDPDGLGIELVIQH
jgi:catechol 2,3-dioxygenase-like lactoylglutathione lyase family enzyme